VAGYGRARHGRQGNNIMKIVSWYTPGNYEKEAERLRRSVERLGLQIDIYVAHELERKRWRDVVLEKPKILRHFLMKYCGESILMVDADAVLWDDPERRAKELWGSRIPFALGVHKLGDAWCSGTILTNGSEASIALARLWEIEQERRYYAQPQQALSHVPGVSTALGAEWCWICGISRKAAEPIIIEHLQASRSFRRDRRPSRRLLEARIRRVEKIECELSGTGADGLIIEKPNC